MAKEFSRARRIVQQILRELAQLFRFEAKDQRLTWVTPVDVRLSPDFSIASVYVGVLGKSESEAVDIMKVLNSAAGFFRTELGKRMMLRFTPQPRFYFGSVGAEGQKVDALLKRAADISKDVSDDEAPIGQG